MLLRKNPCKKSVNLSWQFQSKSVDIDLNEFDFKTAYELCGKGRMYYEKESETCISEKSLDIDSGAVSMPGLTLCCFE